MNLQLLSATTEKACIEAADPAYRLDPNGPSKVIDGTLFRHSLRGGAAAGTETSFDRYSGFEQKKCFEFTVAISHSALANYEPGSIKDFTKRDEARVTAELNRIIASFHAVPQHGSR